MTDRGLSSKEVWSLGLCVLTATCAILLLLSASSVFSAPQSTTGNLATFFAPPFEFPEGQDSLCRPADWVPPLAIPLDIRDTFGPRLLKPGEHSRYDFHRGMDWPADPDTLVYAVTTGTVRAFRDGWTDSMGSGSWYTYLPTVLRDFSSSGLEVDVQGCLDTTVRAEDLVDIYLEGNDVVVRHDKVIYNCCAEIVVHLIDERPVLMLVECEDYSGSAPCRCLCPYNVSARVPDLPSGPYLVQVWNCDQSHLYGEAKVTVP